MTNQPSVRVFIDTNVFVQLRDLKDLPWREVFGAGWIEVVVAPVVIEELDRFKVDRDNRKRDRSRLALALIQETSAEPGMCRILRDEPKVSLRLAATSRFDWLGHPLLDPASDDDRLVAAALSDTGEGPITLLSFDTGPVIRARLSGLDAHFAPAGWHLPDQSTTDEQERARMKRDLDEARATKPTLAVRFPESSGDRRLSVRIPRLAPLSVHLQGKLTRAHLAKHPRVEIKPTVHNFGLSFLNDDSHSSYALERYEADYVKFAERTEQYFQNLHETLASTGWAFKIDYEVENVGQVTATNPIITFEGPEDATLVADAEDASGWVGKHWPPQPPKRPQTQRESQLDRISPLLSHRPPKPRDPTGFFWQTRPSGKTIHADLICAEFRAKRLWRDDIYLYPLGDPPYEGSLTMRVSATNSPAPVSETVRVLLDESDVTWTDSDVLSRLPDWVTEIIVEDANSGA